MLAQHRSGSCDPIRRMARATQTHAPTLTCHLLRPSSAHLAHGPTLDNSANAPMTSAADRKTVEHWRPRVKATKRQLDWLHACRRCDWQAIRAAEIEARLALGHLAAAEGK